MPTNLTVVVPDRPGAVNRICEALEGVQINIEGICASKRSGQSWGVLDILVEDAATARKAIEEAGFEVTYEREPLVIEVEDRPGALAEVLRSFSNKGLNLELLYFASRHRLVLATEDMHEKRPGVKTTEVRYP